MAADERFKDEVMEMLSPLGEVRSRAMFGGFGIFHEDRMFALISGSTLYLKADDSNRQTILEAGGEQFSRMPYFSVPSDVFADVGTFHDWANSSIRVGHATARKKRK